MATTLTDKGEITQTWFSFPIEKTETTADGDLIVYGKVTDGSVDFDKQIVDPAFARKAAAAWYDSGGNLRVMHNPQLYPAGKAIEWTSDGNAVWAKSLVVEDTAKKLVQRGVLRAYSVGIARPTIERDITGKAAGGIITGGEFVEVSLVDRPANRSCGIQLVKSTGGTLEFTGQVFGNPEDIQKMLTATDEASPAETGDISAFTAPDISLNIDFTPDDMMRLMQEKIVRRHYDDLASKALRTEEAEILGKDHREFSEDQRRQHAKAGNALSDGSYPIPDKDALRRAAILARSKHGNWQAASKLIARRARELGVSNPMDDSPDNSEKGARVTDASVTEVAEVTQKEAQPDVIKDPQDVDADGDHDNDGVGVNNQGAGNKAAAKKPKKGKGGKTMPPWLNKPSSDGDDSSCKMDHAHTEKCHTDPKTASGAEEPADMQPAPVGELVESPAKPHMKSLSEMAFMRFKTVGIDPDMGMLHDLSCPAFHPEEVVKYYPYADFASLIDEELWQRKALSAAAGKSMSEAMEAQQAWQAAVTLKYADPGMVNDFRTEAYKAFRDANPGPTSFPTPGAISPQKFNRPCITEGHAALSPGYSGPNSSPQVASGTPNAHSFARPPLSSGHQSPSPSFMKASFEYPAQQGVPTQIRYADLEKEKARRALSMLHDHLNHMFPSSCPMLDQDAYRQEDGHTVAPALPVGNKSVPANALADAQKYIEKLERKVQAGEITPDQARARLSKRTAQKYAKELTRQVKQGLTSIGEVSKALGLPQGKPETVTLKADNSSERPTYIPTPAGLTPGQVWEFQKYLSEAGLGQKVLLMPPGGEIKAAEPDITKAADPDVMKSMFSEILQPFEERITAQENQLTEYQKTIESQQAEISQHQQRWDALANRPDPATIAFAGMAFNPVAKSPEGIVKQAEVHKSVQGMMERQLERTWRTSEHPAEREAAYAALCRLKGLAE